MTIIVFTAESTCLWWYFRNDRINVDMSIALVNVAAMVILYEYKRKKLYIDKSMIKRQI